MSAVENRAGRRREGNLRGPCLDLEDLVEACETRGLLDPREARFVRERRSIQEATVERRGGSAADPLAVLLSYELSPPGRK